MNLRLVPELNSFQRLVVIVVQELWRQGYDLYGATDERICRIATTHPRAREALNEQGHEWVWDDSDRMRLSECVRANMAAREAKVYVFESLVDIEDRVCKHGKRIYCRECWLARQKVPPGRRR